MRMMLVDQREKMKKYLQCIGIPCLQKESKPKVKTLIRLLNCKLITLMKLEKIKISPSLQLTLINLDNVEKLQQQRKQQVNRAR
jgi:hypothetical protein